MNNLTLFTLSLLVGIMVVIQRRINTHTIRQFPSIEQINRWSMDQIERKLNEGKKFETQLKNYF